MQLAYLQNSHEIHCEISGSFFCLLLNNVELFWYLSLHHYYITRGNLLPLPKVHWKVCKLSKGWKGNLLIRQGNLIEKLAEILTEKTHRYITEFTFFARWAWLRRLKYFESLSSLIMTSSRTISFRERTLLNANKLRFLYTDCVTWKVHKEVRRQFYKYCLKYESSGTVGKVNV